MHAWQAWPTHGNSAGAAQQGDDEFIAIAWDGLLGEVDQRTLREHRLTGHNILPLSCSVLV